MSLLCVRTYLLTSEETRTTSCCWRSVPSCTSTSARSGCSSVSGWMLLGEGEGEGWG